MALEVKRKEVTAPTGAIKEVRLESDGGSGHALVITRRAHNNGQLSIGFRTSKRKSAGEIETGGNFNVFNGTMVDFARAIIELVGGE